MERTDQETEDEPSADDWARVAAALKGRMRELSFGPSDIRALGGPTDRPLAGYLAGGPIVRQDVKRRLSNALGWTPGSIDMILRGRDPTVLANPVTDRTEPGQTLRSIQRELSQLTERLEAVLRDLDLP